MALNKKYSRYIVIALLTTLLTIGCTKENTINNNTPLGFSISTKILSEEKIDGTQLSNTRLIVIDKSSSYIIFNRSTSNGLTEITPGSQTYAFELVAGDYVTYVVANESKSMKEILDNATKSDDLSTVSINGIFDETTIPFSEKQDFIVRKKQSSDGTPAAEVSIDGGATWQNKLDISLKRTQCKVSLYLRKKTGLDGEIKITNVELCNIPDKSYLIPKIYESINPQERVVFNETSGIILDTDVADGNEELTSYKKIFDSGVIFPEKIMSDPTDNSKATYLKIHTTYGTINHTYTIKLRDDLNVENYDLTRNMHYKVYGTITQVGGVISATFELAPWKDGGTIDVEGPGGLYYLNTSNVNFIYPNILYFDKDKNAYIKNTNGDYSSIPEYKYSYYFWTNKASSTVSITNFKSTQTPDEPIGITNSMLITKDEKVGDDYYVTGKIDVNITADEIIKGFQKSYFMNIKADKIYRKLSFEVTKYDIIPEIIALDPTELTKTIKKGETVTDTVNMRVYMPIGAQMSFDIEPKTNYITSKLIDVTPAGSNILEPRKYIFEYTPKYNITGNATHDIKFKLTRNTILLYESPFSFSLTINN